MPRARRSSLEIARERAEVARLRREAAFDTALAGRAKALSGSFTNANRTRLRPGTKPVAGSGQAHRDSWSRETLRRECQAVHRNNPIAQAIIDRVCELLIGDGPSLACISGDEGWNIRAQDRFAEWAAACDLTGRFGLADLLEHGIVAGHTDGRLLLVKTRGDSGEGVLQEIEDQRVGDPRKGADDEGYKGGVELDHLGRPRGYVVTEWRRDGSSTTTTPRTIDAAHVIEMVNPRVRTAGVVSPEPLLASVLTELELLDDSVESTAVAYRVATLLAAFWSTTDPQGLQASMQTGLGADGDYTTTPSSGDPSEVEMQPGMLGYLPPNSTVSQIKPEHPATGIDKFAWMMVQIVAARLGCAVDLTHFVMDGNYSATRARLAMTWRAQACWRRHLRRVLTRVSRWKIAEWIRRGELPEVDGWDRHEWQLAPMPMLDPRAEIETQLTAIDGLLLDYQTASDTLGLGDWKATVKSRRDQLAAMQQAGLAPVRPGLQAGAQPGQLGTDNQPLNTGT